MYMTWPRSLSCRCSICLCICIYVHVHVYVYVYDVAALAELQVQRDEAQGKIDALMSEWEELEALLAQ